jgi:hypothetical protein
MVPVWIEFERMDFGIWIRGCGDATTGRPLAWSTQRRTVWLAIALAGSLLAGAGPALAASPLAWSSPTLIDSQPPYPELDGVSCPSGGLCVAVDAFGNVVTSTDPTDGAGAWVLANVDRANRVWSVSCTSESLCVAVDSAGDVLTSTEPTGGTSKWSAAHVDGSHELLGVSCVSGTLCVAIDGAGDVVTSTDPSGGEHAWTVTHVDEHLLRDVSCASTSLCVAVDANGNVVTSTDPTGGSSAWTVSNVDSDNYILGISCPSVGLCVATDGVGNVLTSTDPAGGVGEWSTTQVEERVLGGVSCSSEALCVAFDGKGNVLTSTEPTKGKSAWTEAHVDSTNFVWGVSCTTGLCVAVDGYGNALTSTNPAQGVDSWATMRVDSSNPAGLTSVSCASMPLLCVAVDSGGDEVEDVVTSTDPTGGGAAWTTTPLETGPLASVSCPSTTLCVAGNSDKALFTSTDPTGGASAWTPQTSYAYPELESPNTEYFGPLASVSCASVSVCLADLDSYNDFDTLATSIDPTGGESAWSSTTPYIAGDRSDKPILDVSCASMSLCVAVDGAGNVLTSTHPASSESSWTITPVDAHPLWGVSCPSDSFCVAVDGAGNVVNSTDPTGRGSAWSVAKVDGTTKLTSVSCASETLCVAVDAAGNVLSSTDPAGGFGAWSVVPADPGHALTSVSCTPAGLCVAVDDAGYAVTGTVAPQAEGDEPGGGQADATTTSTSPSLPPAAFVASGMFRVLSAKGGRDGQIVLTLEAPAPGSIDAKATTVKRAVSAGAHKARCKVKCVRKVSYGASSITVPGAGATSITVKPTRSTLVALRSLHTLRVSVTLKFDPREGATVARGEVVTVHYQPIRQSKH